MSDGSPKVTVWAPKTVHETFCPTLALIVAGICVALIGVVALISGSTAKGKLQAGPEFHIFVNLANQTWAWVAAAALFVVAVAAFFIWPMR